MAITPSTDAKSATWVDFVLLIGVGIVVAFPFFGVLYVFWDVLVSIFWMLWDW
jgi:hypothetical protein